MVQVIKSQIITERVQTVQGEITVNLNLTITLNQDGSLKIDTNPQRMEKTEKIDYDTNFLIPDFGETSEILADFGEDVGG